MPFKNRPIRTIMHPESGILEAFQAKALKWITCYRVAIDEYKSLDLGILKKTKPVTTFLNLLRSCLHGDNKDKSSDFSTDIALVISNLNSG